jgi:hypothetical protein
VIGIPPHIRGEEFEASVTWWMYGGSTSLEYLDLNFDLTTSSTGKSNRKMAKKLENAKFETLQLHAGYAGNCI